MAIPSPDPRTKPLNWWLARALEVWIVAAVLAMAWLMWITWEHGGTRIVQSKTPAPVAMPGK